MPFSLYLYALRGFYALGDTRTPFLLNVGENVVNVGLAVVAFDRWGVRGLAGSYAAAYAVAAVVATTALRRRIGPVLSGSARLLTAAVVAGGGCAAAAWTAAEQFDRPALRLAVGVVAGGVVYAAVLIAGAGPAWRDALGGRAIRTGEAPIPTIGV